MGAEHLQILSLNYQHASIEDVGLLHVAPEAQPDVIRKWVDTLELNGMVFLSTCNRVDVHHERRHVLLHGSHLAAAGPLQPRT